MDARQPGAVAPDFLPALQAWFSERYGEPTDIQALAWGHIAAGEHLLITAPTGSGKTLAAFLWSLNQLADQRWPLEVTSVLYVSPLKALNNDIQRNLLTPLAELAAAFAARGESFPEIRVQTRSGDTPQNERQRMLRRPPEILITTPESLNLLLATGRGQAMLRHLRTVILDEVHAVAGTKRGVHLMTAVERLVELSGEFQRLSLSATVRPAEAVARFVGGQRRLGPDQYAPRPVRVLTSSLRKEVSLRVCLPPAHPDHTAVVDRVTPLLREVIDRNRSTLVFVNSRRLSESLTATLNADVDEPRAYAHHGSLSREVRLAVEERLKAGRLRSIVATSSLELGIDVGALDETVLVQAPPSVAAAVQRIGRAGHQVGQVSRGTLVAIHPHDLLELAAVTQATLEGAIEPTTPIDGPLDVLAQVIVGAVAAQERTADELFDLIRTSFPYRDLKRPPFDLVVQMLCGRYAGTRLRELQPRLSVDPVTNGLRANPAGLQALRASGGTIPDRGYFQLRHLETRARLGELDEEFVWENGPGSRFTFGNRQWRVEKVTHSEVLALPAGGKANIPFWRAEEPSRTFHLAERVGLLLQTCEEQRDDPELGAHLQRSACLEETAARELLAYLDDQRAATGCPLPHRHHLLVEYLESGPQEAPGNQIYLHAVWGRDVTRPFALALGAAWVERYGHAPEIHANNDGISLILSQELPIDDLLSLVTATDAERLLRRSLETSSFFGARFRECAGRALLLAHGPVGRRTPLWLSRLKAQEVLDAAVGLTDFPVLLEAWRTCCQDEFDLDSLSLLLHELEDGRIAVSSVRLPAASPFARRDVWRQVNEYVYAEEPAARGPSSLREDLVRTVALDPSLRPGVAPAIAEELQGKLQRLTPGYGPQTSRELVDWIGERLLVPWEEWLGLVAQLPPEARQGDEWEPRLVRLEPVLARAPLVCSRANLEALYRGLFADHTVHAATLGGAELELLEVMPAEAPEEPPDPVELLAWWLSFYGPVPAAWIGVVLGLTAGRVTELLEPLTNEQRVVVGPLLRGSDEELFCDARNLESLLRLGRARAAVTGEPVPLERLPWILACRQGLVGSPKSGAEAVIASLERLACLSLTTELWEQEVLPARVPGYDPHWLDRALFDAGMSWVGRPDRRLAFLLEGDLALLAPSPEPTTAPSLVPAAGARYTFRDLQSQNGIPAEPLARGLWEEAWQGRTANDGFAALRGALAVGFRFPTFDPGVHRGRRGRRPEAPGCFSGHWYRVETNTGGEGDAVDREELSRDRVRLILDRYGVLCRPLLEREEPALRWSSLFRSIRLMELSGELISGTFLADLPGPQFTTPTLLPLLATDQAEEVFWLSAADPASLCGVDLPLPARLPRRTTTTHLVYRGWSLALVSRRYGRILEISLPPDHPDLGRCLGVLQHLLSRPLRPRRRICVEEINGDPATTSPYLPVLRAGFDTWVEGDEVILHRKRPGEPVAR